MIWKEPEARGRRDKLPHGGAQWGEAARPLPPHSAKALKRLHRVWIPAIAVPADPPTGSAPFHLGPPRQLRHISINHLAPSPACRKPTRQVLA